MLTRVIQGALLAVALAVAAVAYSASEVADSVMRGDRTALASLLERQIDVNEPQADGATALHWAVYRNEPGVVETLLDAGANASAANREGMTPLALATQNGSVEIVRLLLGAGARADETLRNGETELMMAARTGSVDIIDLLIGAGAEVDAKESLRGTTALMWAAAYGNPGAVQVLVAHGADIAARSDAVERGRRPYLAPSAKSRIEAFERGEGQAGTAIPVTLGEDEEGPRVSDADIVGDEFIFDPAERAAIVAANAGGQPESADPTPSAQGPRRDEDETTGSGDFFGRGGDNAKEWGGLTALVFAAREGGMESTRILVEAGADVDEQTEYGWTPLLTATQNRYYQLGKYLLEHGADPRTGNKGNWTPLYIATDNRNIEGGDYPTRKPDMDHLEFIELLLEAGADPNARMNSSTETRTIFTHQWLYEEGATPFLRAAQSSDLELMRLLLEHGADPNIATYDNVTPLMVASGIGWVEGVTYEWSREANVAVIELLLELGADVNAQDTLDGRTALMGAAHKGRSEVVEMLVDAGADLAAHDIGSRDSIHLLQGVTWQAIDYADGLVRVGVQSAIAHPETAALLRELMLQAGLEVPPAGRTLDSICVVDICK